MTILFEGRFPRTLGALVSRFGRAGAGGTALQAWSFDDAPARREAERRLARFGVEARLRSAYKPLLHFFLEEVECAALARVHVRYPVHPDAAAPNRFRLEAYPLAALVEGAAIAFEPNEGAGLFYEVRLAFADGREETHRVFAPNRLHVDATGETLLSPTGWLALGGAAPEAGERLETEFEALFEAAIAAVAACERRGRGPFFGELNLRATLPFAETPLRVGEEFASLREALHEDLYFSLLELFGREAGLAADDRGVTPGQIVPEILFSPGDATLRIETRPLCAAEPDGCEAAPDDADAPLSAAAVARALDAIDGELFEARSRAGRPVRARHRRGAGRAMMISGGQHANEPSGIVGALRGARALAGRENAHFTVAPLENPDGQALHLRLCHDNPGHMHHAARYTALGDDLEYRETGEPFERAIRLEAEARTGALLHVNLHGYPAHEWTRPLSGYVPRGFALWTLPKGFFLILRHHAGWREAAAALADHVTRHLARAVPGLVAFNERQVALYRIHAGEPGFSLVNGFPCLLSPDARHASPLTLITEHPDETVRGAAFRLAQAAQTQTVIAAYEALQDMAIPVSAV